MLLARLVAIAVIALIPFSGAFAGPNGPKDGPAQVVGGHESAPVLAAPALRQPPPPPSAHRHHRDDIDVTVFYEHLARYGEWFYRAPYGWVWTPLDVGPDWRPYWYGHWVWTDYGWTWHSHEPFGWAVYHYGRWQHDPYYGWIWIPDGTWSPAWVAWRRGDGWIGWAPLPPEDSVNVGIQVGGFSFNLSAIKKHQWNFVEERSFIEEDLRPYVARPSRNVNIVNNTQNVTNYTVVNNTVVNNSVKVETVEKRIGRKVPRYKLQDSSRPDDGAKIDRRSAILSLFRPKLDKGKPAKTPDKIFPRRGDRENKAKDEMIRRHKIELDELDRRAAKERAAFEDRTKRERARASKMKISLDDLNKRHVKERQALEDQLKRERKLMERQHERELKGEFGNSDFSGNRWRFGGRDDRKKD